MFHHHRLLSPSLQPSSDRRWKPAPGFSRIVRSLPKHLSICLAEITKPNKRLLLCTSDSLSFLVVDVRVPPVACSGTPARGTRLVDYANSNGRASVCRWSLRVLWGIWNFPSVHGIMENNKKETRKLLVYYRSSFRSMKSTKVDKFSFHSSSSPTITHVSVTV